jgi:hypothetical protein
MRFTIPADPDQADALAGELGELATATEWRRAAIVYSRVHVRDSQGRPTEKVTRDHLMTPAEYADKGVYGLRSRTTIRAYWRAWHRAIADGLAQTVSLGDEIELPSVEWNDYYRPLDLTTPPAAADYVPPPPNDGDTNVVSMPARDSSTRRDALGGLFNRMGSCTDVTISEPARAPGPPVDYHELLRDQHHARVLDQVDAVRDSDAARITDSEAARIRRKVDRDNVEMWLRLTEDNSLRAAEAAERCGRFDHAERLLDQIETIRDRLAAIAHAVREARPWETLDPSALTLDPLVENGIPASVLPASTQIYTLGEAPVRRTAPSPV